MTNPVLLSCGDVTKVYRGGGETLTVLDGLRLEVRANAFTAITGESGCGKSTLLHILGCLDDPTSGSIRFGDTEYASLTQSQKDRLRNREFGFVFQFHHLLPEFTALENVIMPGLIAGRSHRELLDKGMELLGELNLKPRAGYKPPKLSGGEQQRVAVARAMINRPALLFMDEPTGNLDPVHSRELIELIRLQQQTKNLTIVMVTHNREIAAEADVHCVLSRGQLSSPNGADA